MEEDKKIFPFSFCHSKYEYWDRTTITFTERSFDEKVKSETNILLKSKIHVL